MLAARDLVKPHPAPREQPGEQAEPACARGRPGEGQAEQRESPARVAGGERMGGITGRLRLEEQEVLP